MALPATPSRPWLQSIESPSQLLDVGRYDYELYEEEDKFVLTIEIPGFDRDDIHVGWDEGVLNIAAEIEDEARGQVNSSHRRFRVPKEIIEDDITATYGTGILEVTLPISPEARVAGTEIPIEG